MTITNHQMIFKFYSNRAQICLKISCCLQEKEKSIIINMKIEEKKQNRTNFFNYISKT